MNRTVSREETEKQAAKEMQMDGKKDGKCECRWITGYLSYRSLLGGACFYGSKSLPIETTKKEALCVAEC